MSASDGSQKRNEVKNAGDDQSSDKNHNGADVQEDRLESVEADQAVLIVGGKD